MVPRILLVAPTASYRTASYLQAAVDHGIELLIASEGRNSLVSAYAEGLHIDFSDLDNSLRLIESEARKRPFRGVVATDDDTTEFASRIARRLELPHNRPDAVRTARRKDLAREALAASSMTVPDFKTICLDRPFESQISDIQFPCVIKPLAMSGSRGVMRCDNRGQLLAAAKRIEPIIAEADAAAEQRNFLLESYIPGFEIAVEGMLERGKLDVLAVFDKPEALEGPYFEESYYICPSRLEKSVQSRVREEIEAACLAYGLSQGPIHAECRINDKGVWIIELASRTIGGLCSRLFHFNVGYSLEELVLHQAMGISLHRIPLSQAAGVLMIPIAKAGVLRRVEGIRAAGQVRYIEEVVIQVREGYELVPLPEGSSYLGFIFASAPDADRVEQALRDAHARLNIVVAPVWNGVVATNGGI